MSAGVMTAPSLSQAGFDSFLALRTEPAWLTALRKSAWEEYLKLPVPSLRDEEWMRTDIRTFRWQDQQFPSGPAGGDWAPSGMLAEKVQLGGNLVTVNGQAVFRDVSARLSEQGVLFCSLEQAAAEHGELLKQHLLQHTFQVNYDKFAALHAAAMSGGAFVYVPRGVHVEEPLRLLTAASAGGSDFSHILVVLEDNASLTLLSETESQNVTDAGFHCGGIEITVGAGAQLRYVNLQNWGNRFWHFAHQKAVVQAGGKLQWTIGALGGKLAKVNQHVALAGRQAEAQVNGVMFTEDHQHFSYHTLQHHQAPQCRSDLLYEGAQQGQSRTVWRGMIKVDKQAHKTDGYQRNDNLMLSAEARADSIPGLEIEADDVRCTHGATAGRVEDEMIFYAQSRGLTRNEAIRTIVAGFFQKVFDRITVESVREALGRAIGNRIREHS